MNFCRKWSVLAALCLAAALPLSARADEKKPVTLEDIKKDLELIAAMQRFQTSDLADLKSRVLALEKRVESLEKGQVRTSFAPPLFGTIRLENRLARAATILVNDVPYRLQPFQTRNLPAFPAGTFNFEALVDGYGSLQPRAMRTLQPNQVYTIFTFE